MLLILVSMSILFFVTNLKFGLALRKKSVVLLGKMRCIFISLVKMVDILVFGTLNVCHFSAVFRSSLS